MSVGLFAIITGAHYAYSKRANGIFSGPAAQQRRLCLRIVLLLACLGGVAMAQTRPTEIHDRIGQARGPANQVALTLDACSGAFDEDLVLFLIRNRIPATLFVTKKWLDKNPNGLAVLKTNLDLFDIEDHGENHIPAVIGAGRKVYGIAGEPDVVHLRREVLEGARNRACNLRGTPLAPGRYGNVRQRGGRRNSPPGFWHCRFFGERRCGRVS